jgi:hypothetical protein
MVSPERFRAKRERRLEAPGRANCGHIAPQSQVGIIAFVYAGIRRTPIPYGFHWMTNSHGSIDICPHFSYDFLRISLTSGSSTGDSRLMGRVRFLRAGLVTPLPGGPGIGPAGITTGARGAPLKRDQKRRLRLRVFIARSTARAESKRSVAATSAAVERREASGPRWGRFRAADGFAQTA